MNNLQHERISQLADPGVSQLDRVGRGLRQRRHQHKDCGSSDRPARSLPGTPALLEHERVRGHDGHDPGMLGASGGVRG